MTRRTVWRVGAWLAVAAVALLSEVAGCALVRGARPTALLEHRDEKPPIESHLQ